MQSMINQDFENLAQRSIYNFIATYSPFYPIKSTEVSTEEQRNAYDFIKNIFERAYENPVLIGLKIEPDDSYGNWELHKTKPKLAPAIRDNIKKLEELINVLWSVSLNGHIQGETIMIKQEEIDLKSSLIKKLSAIGLVVTKLEDSYVFHFNFSPKGLKLLAEISLKNEKVSKDGHPKPYLLFSRGVFDAEATWLQEVFGTMFVDRKPYDRLMTFLQVNNYQRIDNKEHSPQISIDYIKCYGKIDDPLKAAWGERTHGGIEFTYEECRKHQSLIGLRIPYFSEILKNHEKMNEKLKGLVIYKNKKCDGCRYCVQTDKTGKRPFAFVDIDGHKLCTMFAGFMYVWRELDDLGTDCIIEMLTFIDELFADRRVK